MFAGQKYTTRRSLCKGAHFDSGSLLRPLLSQILTAPWPVLGGPAPQSPIWVPGCIPSNLMPSCTTELPISSLHRCRKYLPVPATHTTPCCMSPARRGCPRSRATKEKRPQSHTEQLRCRRQGEARIRERWDRDLGGKRSRCQQRRLRSPGTETGRTA